jgi:uncharacterized RDD family membrane protein YckC
VERYDNGTRIWTTISGVAVAAVIDWLAVVNPARGYSPVDAHTGWWVFGLCIVCIAPLAWFIGSLTRRDYASVAIWIIVVAIVIVAHYIPLSWAQGQQ